MPLVGWAPCAGADPPAHRRHSCWFPAEDHRQGFHGREVAVEGTLVYTNDYDLFLRVDMFPDKRLHWWQTAGTAPGVITVDKSAIVRVAAL